jgi:hypothetical protein
MRYRKLDQDNDMQFGNQQADFYRDVPEAPAQAVGTRLRLVSGEWYLNINEGTPYQGGVLGKYTKDSADPVIRSRILGTQGVDSILDYESGFDPDTRAFAARGEINTIYGPAPINEVL